MRYVKALFFALLSTYANAQNTRDRYIQQIGEELAANGVILPMAMPTPTPIPKVEGSRPVRVVKSNVTKEEAVVLKEAVAPVKPEEEAPANKEAAPQPSQTAASQTAASLSTPVPPHPNVEPKDSSAQPPAPPTATVPAAPASPAAVPAAPASPAAVPAAPASPVALPAAAPAPEAAPSSSEPAPAVAGDGEEALREREEDLKKRETNLKEREDLLLHVGARAGSFGQQLQKRESEVVAKEAALEARSREVETRTAALEAQELEHTRVLAERTRVLEEKDRAIAELEAKERAIAELQTSLDGRQKAVDDHQRAVEEQQRVVEEHQRAIEERERRVADQEQQAARRLQEAAGATVDAAQQEIAAKLAASETANQELTAKLAAIESVNQELTAKLAASDSASQELTAKLAASDSASQELTAKLAASDSASQELAAKLAAGESANQELTDRLAERERAVLEQERDVAERVKRHEDALAEYREGVRREEEKFLTEDPAEFARYQRSLREMAELREWLRQWKVRAVLKRVKVRDLTRIVYVASAMFASDVHQELQELAWTERLKTAYYGIFGYRKVGQVAFACCLLSLAYLYRQIRTLHLVKDDQDAIYRYQKLLLDQMNLATEEMKRGCFTTNRYCENAVTDLRVHIEKQELLLKGTETGPSSQLAPIPVDYSADMDPNRSPRESFNGGPLPPAGGPLLPAGGTLPPAGGTLSAAGGTLSAAGGTLPPSVGTLPPAGGTLPPSVGTLPPSVGTLPPADGALSPSVGTLPPSVDTIPPSGGTIAHAAEFLPTDGYQPMGGFQPIGGFQPNGPVSFQPMGMPQNGTQPEGPVSFQPMGMPQNGTQPEGLVSFQPMGMPQNGTQPEGPVSFQPMSMQPEGPVSFQPNGISLNGVQAEGVVQPADGPQSMCAIYHGFTQDEGFERAVLDTYRQLYSGDSNAIGRGLFELVLNVIRHIHSLRGDVASLTHLVQFVIDRQEICLRSQDEILDGMRREKDKVLFGIRLLNDKLDLNNLESIALSEAVYNDVVRQISSTEKWLPLVQLLEHFVSDPKMLAAGNEDSSTRCVFTETLEIFKALCPTTDSVGMATELSKTLKPLESFRAVVFGAAQTTGKFSSDEFTSLIKDAYPPHPDDRKALRDFLEYPKGISNAEYPVFEQWKESASPQDFEE
ncbi:hypothetical protein GNI_084230 [Gregarina niphandrodes]|uniref:Transmembrane protein n=1 Tax=Gregarina niphandrodes TaxID=110365 RepID=A0A023B644_GRENI|nr:hypothetical protein GNI_084230 [Gregarina niphandrodes]EZG65146.1 hypothetical protein GNI_084230 [Gregarina niphandrodes]|eukprot:XP_011134100.1 hypothetical protein GNI_084230 [Gregarina niphandrodes]